MHNGNVARKKTSFKIKFYIEIQISHQAEANRKMGSKILNLVPHVGVELQKQISGPNQISDVYSCCSFQCASVGIRRTAKVCCRTSRCVATGASSAANSCGCTCWTSSWPTSASLAATASSCAAPTINAAVVPVRYAPKILKIVKILKIG